MKQPDRTPLRRLRHARRGAAPAALVLAAVTVLAACGDDGATPMGDHGAMMSTSSPVTGTTASATAGTPAAGPRNQADIDFAAGMVPHHQQALEMADMALAHGGTEEFLALAEAIKAAQQPEIDQMSGWLAGWGQPVPEGGDHMDHSGMGMMSQQELDDLDALQGIGFEGMWLVMMIRHHEGAVAMAQAELDQGANAEAKKLAQAIIETQTAEITRMRAMKDERAN
jgi:uncharacterized protein (DUF305 family)